MTGARGSAAPKAAKAPPRGETGGRIVVPFEDNRLLTQVLGEYDAHLAMIEERLNIGAHAHGNIITLTGDRARCEMARDVLLALYERAEKGEPIGTGDVDGLIRHARSGAPRQDGMAQIRTRRRIVTARTPM